MGLSEAKTLDEVRARFREMAHAGHPDRGGTHDAMAKLNTAMEAAERELGGGQ